jgi:hypothetical protein
MSARDGSREHGTERWRHLAKITQPWGWWPDKWLFLDQATVAKYLETRRWDFSNEVSQILEVVSERSPRFPRGLRRT